MRSAKSPIRFGFGLTGAFCAVASTIMLGGLFVPIMKQIGWFSNVEETGILTDVALGMAAAILAAPIAGLVGFAFGRRLGNARPGWRNFAGAEVVAALASTLPWAIYGLFDGVDIPFFVLGIAVTGGLSMAAAALAMATFVLIQWS